MRGAFRLIRRNIVHKVRLSIVGMMIGIGCMVGLTQTTPVEAAKKDKVTICHRTTAVNNPYVVLKVDPNAVDGIAGNSGNIADHYGEHQGPLASSQAVAQSLKDAKVKWGDIIPPVPGAHNGLNWTTEGQAIYNNDCNYTTTTSNISYEQTCVFVNNVATVRVTMTNTGNGDGVITVNGEDVVVLPGATVSRDFSSGTHITITLNGAIKFDQVVECSDNGTPTPKIDFDLVCDLNQRAAVITFSNSGNADGTAILNGDNVAVLAGVPVTRTIPTGANGVTVTIEIDGKTVFNQLVNCQPGKGGGSVSGGGTTPVATNAKQLPNTAGNTDQVALAVVGGLATVITLASLAMRSFLARSL